MRKDGRKPDELRQINITMNYQLHPLASVLIETGNTQVLCAVSDNDDVPPFLTNQNSGWVTAEYSLLPSSTAPRTIRESMRGRPGGRTLEIQRFIGRTLRSITNLKLIGPRTLTVDCDVIQADGGTRTAAITGGFVALAAALHHLRAEGKIADDQLPLKDYLAATSVGISKSGDLLLDLNYKEDSSATADLNVVRTGDGRYIEIQGGAEKDPMTFEQLTSLLHLADKGIQKLVEAQKRVIGQYFQK